MKKQVFTLIAILAGSFALLSMTVLKYTTQESWEVPAKYNKMKNPFLNSSDDEQIGRILYSKHCKSCHGSKGKGDGKKAASLDTPVEDFTDGTIKNQTDGSIYYKTVFGRDDMPSFEKKISVEEERWLLINYLKTL